MNRNDIAYQISTTLDDYADDYNIDAIVDEIEKRHGLVDIDSIDSTEYWEIVERHDTTA